MQMAQERGLDLVEVSPGSRPPVCRIMDFGKYKYEQSKKAKEARKKQHQVVVKEVQFRPKIGDSDYEVVRRAGELLPPAVVVPEAPLPDRPRPRHSSIAA